MALSGEPFEIENADVMVAAEPDVSVLRDERSGRPQREDGGSQDSACGEHDVYRFSVNCAANTESSPESAKTTAR